MANPSQQSLDPAALAAFAGGLANLPADEIHKAKKLYLLNSIAELQAMRGSMRGMVIIFGVLSIIPIFLIVFIPSFIMYRSLVRASRQKILNAVEVWRDDLGPDYETLRRQANEA